MCWDNFKAFRQAEARNDTLLSIYTPNPLYEAPLIFVLLQDTDSLPNSDHKLVLHRGLERVDDIHQAGEFLLAVA